MSHLVETKSNDGDETGYELKGLPNILANYESMVPNKTDRILMAELAHSKRFDTLAKYFDYLKLNKDTHFKAESVVNHVALHTYSFPSVLGGGGGSDGSGGSGIAMARNGIAAVSNAVALHTNSFPSVLGGGGDSGGSVIAMCRSDIESFTALAARDFTLTGTIWIASVSLQNGSGFTLSKQGGGCGLTINRSSIPSSISNGSTGSWSSQSRNGGDATNGTARFTWTDGTTTYTTNMSWTVAANGNASKSCTISGSSGKSISCTPSTSGTTVSFPFIIS